MGCFLACFGSSKDRRRRKQRHRVLPREQRNAGYNPVQSAVSLAQDSLENPIDSVSEIRDKPEDQLSLSIRKKVTFDGNVKTYDHVSHEEDAESALEKESRGKGEDEKEGSLDKPSQSQSSSQDGSTTSSLRSYPPSHRYQNCIESDDELDYEESDIDNDGDEDEDDDDDSGLDDDDELYDDDKLYDARFKIAAAAKAAVDVETDSSVVTSEREEKLKGNARDRSCYVHPVLNPVENLTQWKAVKAKRAPGLRRQKENLTLDQEPRNSFSLEPSFKESSFSFKTKSEQSKKSNQEFAIDASLSNWLGLQESTTINKASTTGLATSTPEKSMSHGSNSPISFEDRPILGALTLEEIKQFSASSSPRKSPSRSPDDMPIIGTVGTYWSHSASGKSSGSASSYKGIPNTTSKYREDKKVNWHSTPFETRLERALNEDAARA